MTTHTVDVATPAARPWRLGGKTRKGVLVLHVGSAELGEAGRRIAAGGPDTVPLGDMIYPPIVSPTMLVLAMVLSVYKPWGRIRRRKRQ